jgi:Mg2+-importing ATPase
MLTQFKSPIILILVFAAELFFFLRNPMDATIILVIVLVSGFPGFWQDRGALTRQLQKRSWVNPAPGGTIA